jgi:hypothetical protein
VPCLWVGWVLEMTWFTAYVLWRPIHWWDENAHSGMRVMEPNIPACRPYSAVLNLREAEDWENCIVLKVSAQICHGIWQLSCSIWKPSSLKVTGLVFCSTLNPCYSRRRVWAKTLTPFTARTPCYLNILVDQCQNLSLSTGTHHGPLPYRHWSKVSNDSPSQDDS